ncbi:hypothetical protein SASPL_146141 [Salvia splendens]|uniref:F-box domain-containing protein n=1 Tax=Salvia splendens TaxID=180675 RepID=A0A8X8WIU9_SALSN|nr:F-box/kelch-repeat protein At3g23880-like [Salvia splendens]KAG6395496.1 hypothetical protein SASPL_146141 [Salvia splendens]
MNNDACTEILLWLPFLSLLRFRAVCKLWRDIISSQSFGKLHTQTHYTNTNHNNPDDTVYLQFSLPNDEVELRNELSIELEYNEKSLMLYKSDHFNGFSLNYWDNISDYLVRLHGPVRGLICINCNLKPEAPVAICNPFLGQLKTLPLTTSCAAIGFDEEDYRVVAIGFDDEDYKVVQLLSCKKHRCLHAQLYKRRTDSWRELTGESSVLDNQEFDWVDPIQSQSMNGYFTHWRAHLLNGASLKEVILTFDMKNEVFQTITLPECEPDALDHIFAQDEHSFLKFVLPHPCCNAFEDDKLVKVYESICRGSELSWIPLINVEVPFSQVPLLRVGCVFLDDGDGAEVVYDYHARKLIGRHCVVPLAFVEYRGSFVSP